MKYKRRVLTEESGKGLVEICKEISERYEVSFVEIGYESGHIHFLIQSVPDLSLSQIVRTIKSITACELFRLHPEIKQLLWGGNLWTSGFYANTVGLYGNREVIRKYIENQDSQSKIMRKYILVSLLCFNNTSWACPEVVYFKLNNWSDFVKVLYFRGTSDAFDRLLVHGGVPRFPWESARV